MKVTFRLKFTSVGLFLGRAYFWNITVCFTSNNRAVNDVVKYDCVIGLIDCESRDNHCVLFCCRRAC